MGRSPQLIPPLVPSQLPPSPEEDFKLATDIITRLQSDSAEAADNLIAAKVAQAHYSNKSWSPDPTFNIGDHVMLSTFHHRRDYTSGHKGCVAKFMPCFDGPYTVIDTHPQFSTYTLDLPSSKAFPTFHTSLLRKIMANDPDLFPSRKFEQPGPILTPNGLEEYFVERIVDEKRYGRGKRYLVCWKGYDSSHDRWLPGIELKDNAALDEWEARSDED